jgi:hypothetical protein
MDLIKAKKALSRFLEHDIGVEKSGIKVEDFEDNFIMSTSLRSKWFDDDILVIFIGYKGGSFLIKFVLDKLESSKNNLELINTYNQNVSWFKAFIDLKKYLCFEHIVFDLNDEITLIMIVGHLFEAFMQEENLKFLKPIAMITK